MASRNGLNPKIRGPKGVGFGRALPAPFGFGNGYFSPRNTGKYFIIPRLIGAYIPDDVCWEFWLNTTSPDNQQFIFTMGNSSLSSGMYCGSAGPNQFQCGGGFGATGYTYNSFPIHSSSKCHYVINRSRSLNRTGFTSFVNGGAVTGDPTTGADIAANAENQLNSIGNDGKYGNPILIQRLTLGISGYDYSAGITGALGGSMDEFRMYNRCLNKSEAAINYNGRIGNNPAATENLMVWYNFEKFETLDFSVEQDGSDMRLGIRDLSRKFNHAQPVNLDTNPESETYVLNLF